MVYRIVVVDDHRDLRTLFTTFLERSPDFEVCGSGATGVEAIALAERIKPDVMLLDMSMPDIGGMDALEPILQTSPRTNVIVLSGLSSDDFAAKATARGAVGCLEKDCRMTDLADRVLAVLDRLPAQVGHEAAAPTVAAVVAEPELTSFTIVPDSSAILVEARSSVGPITFGATSMTGEVRCRLLGDQVEMDPSPSATLAVPVSALTSGNRLYDAELRGRLDARRFPTITADLFSAELLGPGRFSIMGNLSIHGTSRLLAGNLDITVSDPSTVISAMERSRSRGVTVVATGTQVIDIRDFDIELPTVLMLQIYPEVTVRFRVSAVAHALVPTGE